jgi:DNA-directed RNA polymerase specialized sigma24 family protein
MKERSLKEAFLGSFDSYSDAIFRFCLMKTSNKELAEDFTQETFMRYWQSLREGKTMTNCEQYDH